MVFKGSVFHGREELLLKQHLMFLCKYFLHLQEPMKNTEGKAKKA